MHHNVEYTRIYEYKISVEDLMKFVLAEQARKNYTGTADGEANAAMYHEFSITEDDTHWFMEYLRQALGLICTKLQPLQKYLETPYQMDELYATLRFRLSLLYNTMRLEDVIKEAIGNYVSYRWYLMKNKLDLSTLYKGLFDGNMDELKGFGVRGIYGKSTAHRLYDMGFGAVSPLPYMEKDIVIRDIRWQTDKTDGALFDDDKHLPDKDKRKSKPLPGVIVVGMNELELGDGDQIPLSKEGDAGMIIPANPHCEVVIRNGNETKED